MESNGAPPRGDVSGPPGMSGDDATLDERADPQNDTDQTLSDRDQTLSDRDQQASDDDQAASDLDRDRGGDRASHAHSAAIRTKTSRERLEVGRQRDESASQRDQAAKRDELAAQRDHDAKARDHRALQLDASDTILDRHTLRVQELRARGLEGRRRAAADRERAARDRELAARDREQAKRDREHAGTDELTGARRRGVGIEELEREIDRARRTGQSLVVAYLDVDGLKAVNDEHGHSAGDELLREVAAALRDHMRSYDLLIRLGGDEFLCVLPGVNVEEVRRRLDEIATQLPTARIAGSVSVGLSELRDSDRAQELIDRADHNLLAARGARLPGTAASSPRET